MTTRRHSGPIVTMLVVAAAVTGLTGLAGPAAVAATATATAAPGGHRDDLPVYYGSCRESVRIHTKATTTSTTVGICARGDRIRTNLADYNGGYGTCPDGSRKKAWAYLRDLRTDVVGWTLDCYVDYDDQPGR